MKICNSQAMKIFKELEEKKRAVIRNEANRSKIFYKEGENKVVYNYDYKQTRSKIEKLDRQIRKIKHALAMSNCTAVVSEFNITVGEALVYLAQLNTEYRQLNELANYHKLSRRITANGVLEYTECLYDPDEAAADMQKLYEKICELQVAVDRVNLTTYIEI